MKLGTRTLLPTLLIAGLIGLSLFSVQGQKKTATDWPTFGNDAGGQRYSTLTEITPANVTKLVRAWTYHQKPENYHPPTASEGPQRQPPPRGVRRRNPESQAVPLVVNGVMYLTTAYRRVVALEPETGKELGL